MLNFLSNFDLVQSCYAIQVNEKWFELVFYLKSNFYFAFKVTKEISKNDKIDFTSHIFTQL